MTASRVVAFRTSSWWRLIAGMAALTLGGCAVQVVLPQDRSVVAQSPVPVLVTLPLFFDGRFGAQLNDRDITSDFVPDGGGLAKSARLQLAGGEYRLSVGACGNFRSFFIPVPDCSSAQVAFSVSQRLDLALAPGSVTLMPGDPPARVNLSTRSVNANGSTTLAAGFTPVASAQRLRHAFVPAGAFNLALNGTDSRSVDITAPADTRSGDRTLTVQARSASGATGSADVQVKVECQCSSTGAFVDAEVKPVVSSGGLSGTSPDGRFIVTVVAPANGLPSSLSVASLARPNVPVAGPFSNPQAWGFSPDSRYLVVATPGPSSHITDVTLHDLTTSQRRVLQEQAVGCPVGDLSCRPPPRFCYSGGGQPSNACLSVGGNTTSAFRPGVASWGFGPDSRSFLFVTVNPLVSATQYQLRLYDLPAAGQRVNTAQAAISSFWKFSPCGDLFMHFHQAFATPGSNDSADFVLTAAGLPTVPLQTAFLTLGPGGTVIGPVGGTVVAAPAAADADFNVQLLNRARAGTPSDSFPSPQCRRRP